MWLMNLLRVGKWGVVRQPETDHDRLILLELEQRLTVEQMRREVEAVLRQVEFIDERLDQGNKHFREQEIFQTRANEDITNLRERTAEDIKNLRERTAEDIANVRQRALEARGVADNNERALTALSKAMDIQGGVADDARGRLKDELKEAIRSAVKPVQDEVDGLQKTIETWMIQGRMIRYVWVPISAVLMTILTTFIIRILFPS